MTLNNLNNFILNNKHLGFDDIETFTKKPKLKIIKAWNFLTNFEWKVFTKTKIEDYIKDTGKSNNGRKIYEFTKDFVFYPSPSETVIIYKGWEFDFMSIPKIFQWYIKSDENFGKLASLLHDYRYCTRSKGFFSSNWEFFKICRMFGARLDKNILTYLAVQIGGYLFWFSTNKKQARALLLKHRKEVIKYYLKHGKQELEILEEII